MESRWNLEVLLETYLSYAAVLPSNELWEFGQGAEVLAVAH